MEFLAKYWLNLLSNFKFQNLLNKFKSDIEGFTLHGQYVDSYQLITYPSNAVYFYGITENNNNHLFYETSKAFEFFSKYCLYFCPYEKIAESLTSFEGLSEVLSKWEEVIQSSPMMIQEEGSVRYIITLCYI